MCKKPKASLLEEINEISNMANLHFIRQKELNGLGDAVSYARHHVGKEPFAVLLGDTIIASEVPATRQLIDCHKEYDHSVIAVETVPREKVSRYGIIGGKKIGENIHEVTALIEKPTVEESPSDLAIAGRYILTPEIFDILDNLPRGRNNEVQLTDGLKTLQTSQPVYALTIRGTRYDIGNKLDYLKTQVEYGLRREEFREAFLAFLEQTLKSQ